MRQVVIAVVVVLLVGLAHGQRCHHHEQHETEVIEHHHHHCQPEEETTYETVEHHHHHVHHEVVHHHHHYHLVDRHEKHVSRPVKQQLKHEVKPAPKHVPIKHQVHHSQPRPVVRADPIPAPAPVPAASAKIAVYRYWNGKDHFYTTNSAEIGTLTVGQLGHHGYRYEGVGFHAFAGPNAGHGVVAVPVYRYFNGVDHKYTIAIDEIGTATPGQKGKHGYWSEGIGFYGFASAHPGHGIRTMPVHRYWNGVEHKYTLSVDEIGTATVGQKGKFGYVYEGVGWYAPV